MQSGPDTTRLRAAYAVGCLIALLAIGAAVVSGCDNPFAPRLAPTIGITQQPPEPSSAIGILRLYEWCWNQRDPDLYRELFTDDYQFQFAQTDTAGNAYRDRALNREGELDIATNIFVRGNAEHPPPDRISLVFDPNLISQADSRRGKDPLYHREIAAQTLLRIENPDYEVKGTTRFYVVRGDSALLPKELKDRGFRPDSMRWYIERIDDETLADDPGTRAAGAPGATTMRRAPRERSQSFDPLSLSWGQMKALWDRRAGRQRTAAAGPDPPR